jgi:hypothetical protein
VTLIGKAGEPKPRRLPVRVRPRVHDPGSSNRQDDSPWSCLLGFESLSRNHAAAHGCGSAFVRRMIRVGTGWRLHALVAESGRRASPRSWWSARAVPVQVRASAQCQRIASRLGTAGTGVRFSGQAPCRCGAAVSASPCQGEGREFESRHLLARGCGSAVEHGIPNVVLAVQSRSVARMRWWWNFGRHASLRN